MQINKPKKTHRYRVSNSGHLLAKQLLLPLHHQRKHTKYIVKCYIKTNFRGELSY